MWLERKVQIIMQGTEIIELRAVARDITERKKAEAERRRGYYTAKGGIRSYSLQYVVEVHPQHTEARVYPPRALFFCLPHLRLLPFYDISVTTI